MANTGDVVLNGGTFNINGGVGILVRSGTLTANAAEISITEKENGISNPEKFESRRGLYVTGAVFTILSGPISLPSILYYVNFAIKDQIAIQQSPAQPSESKNDYDDIEKKIKLLRELKDREEITKEEFRKRLSDMLDKDK